MLVLEVMVLAYFLEVISPANPVIKSDIGLLIDPISECAVLYSNTIVVKVDSPC